VGISRQFHIRCTDTHTSNYSVDQIKKNEMGSACGMYGNRKFAYRVLVEQTDGKRHLEDLDIDWGIILKFVFKKWDWEP